VGKIERDADKIKLGEIVTNVNYHSHDYTILKQRKKA
jgi:hypothetical protein